MKIDLIIDPLNKFSKYSEQEIFDTLGVLPQWVINESYFDKDLFAALDTQYCCGMYKSDNVTISENGIYKYDNGEEKDDHLYPLIKIIRGEETFYQYLYGLVSIVQEDGSSYATRMD